MKIFTGTPLTKDSTILRVAGLTLIIFFFVGARFYNPFDSGLIVCGFKQLTGYDCPTCGLSRSTYLLLHFQVRDAVTYHPLSVVIVGGLLMLLVKFALELIVKRELRLRWGKRAIQVAAGQLFRQHEDHRS